MQKFTAEEILSDLAGLLLFYLEELKDVVNTEQNRLLYGKKTAFTEIAEMLQYWEKAEEHGLDFDIEGKYPL